MKPGIVPIPFRLIMKHRAPPRCKIPPYEFFEVFPDDGDCLLACTMLAMLFSLINFFSANVFVYLYSYEA